MRLSNAALELSTERVCRFSANLSGPTRVIKETIEKLSEIHNQHDPDAPWVVKVDGNLDGLTTIQAIRSDVFKLHKQPIITCYPVLKYALQSALGRNAFVKLLALSGADIIYPGQSPNFNKGRRIDTQQVAAAQVHYRQMDLGGYPMLSVAGGIFISSVHATMSLLGGDIAFFVGGGISLSKKGIKRAAQNFSKAIDLSCQDLFEEKTLQRLEQQLVELTKVYFSNSIPVEFDLVLPKDLRSIPDIYKSKNLS